jgi:hypothetical protein
VRMGIGWISRSILSYNRLLFIQNEAFPVQWRSQYSGWLRAGRSGDRIPVGARFYAPVQIGPGAHPDSCTMGTGSSLGVKRGRCVTLTPHHLLVPWSRKSRAIHLLPTWAVRPVQSLGACKRVHFTLPFPVQAMKVCREVEV